MSTAARLSFFGMSEPEAPAPSPTPAPRGPTPTPRPASDRGPEAVHRLHGAVHIKPGVELRVTSQPPTAGRPARILIRRWQQDEANRWWPVRSSTDICWSLHGKDAQSFARAVVSAVKLISTEGGT